MTRLRELGIEIGRLPPGEHNAITDVAGVGVGQATLIADEPHVVRTGVTMVVPRRDEIWTDYAAASWFSFSGNGEMTGIPWIEESGLLGSAIGITNTHQVGLVRDWLVRHAVAKGTPDPFHLPVVAETFDGWLSDIDAFALTAAEVERAMSNVSYAAVEEGNVGGGTGMICHEFKGGIGSSSRVVDMAMHTYTVGVLVQANYGARHDLRLEGVPIGRLLSYEEVPAPWPEERSDGSIIIVIATDAPLLSDQCRRLAKRATVGLGRVGGTGHNGSGDIFLCFSTGNHFPAGHRGPFQLHALPPDHLDGLFRATIEATEEAIWNALCGAETLSGWRERTAHAIPHGRLASLWDEHRPG